MRDGLSDNVKRLDMLRMERGLKKLCNCIEPHYLIDYQNVLVYCKCGAIVDPWVALCNVASHYERIAEYTEWHTKRRQEIDSYKPRLVVIKELEKQYRGSKLFPTCPLCKGGFDLKELLGTMWIHPDYIAPRITRP